MTSIRRVEVGRQAAGSPPARRRHGECANADLATTATSHPPSRRPGAGRGPSWSCACALLMRCPRFMAAGPVTFFVLPKKATKERRACEDARYAGSLRCSASSKAVKVNGSPLTLPSPRPGRGCHTSQLPSLAAPTGRAQQTQRPLRGVEVDSHQCPETRLSCTSLRKIS